MESVKKRILAITGALMLFVGAVTCVVFPRKTDTVASAQVYDENLFTSYLVPLPNLDGFSFVSRWEGTNLDNKLFTSTFGKVVSIAPNEFTLFDSVDGYTPYYASDNNKSLKANSFLYDYNLSASTVFYDEEYGYDTPVFEYPCKIMCYSSASEGAWDVENYAPSRLSQHCFYVHSTSTIQLDTYIYVAKFDGTDEKEALALSLRINVSDSFAENGGMWFIPSKMETNYTQYNAFRMDNIIGWSFVPSTDVLVNGVGKAYDEGYDYGRSVGENLGFSKGYAKGVADAGGNSFAGLISAVIDVPINAFRSLFNFDLLGFNISNFLLSILTLGVVIAIVRLIL